MLNLVELNKKQERLNEIAKELKQELFGIDEIIDKVISLIRVWYLMPQIIDRPVIINLWGLTGVGKAQPLDSKILTPNGWTTMGGISLNDQVITPNGNIANVIGLFPQGKKDIFKVTFSDGRSAECCEDHLWKIYRKSWRNKWKIMSLKEIIAYKETHTNHNLYIPLLSPADSQESKVPMDPWMLGFLLGDGSFRKFCGFSTSDKEILDIMSSKIDDDYELMLMGGTKYDYKIANKDHTKSFKGIKKGKRKNKYLQAICDLNLNGLLSHQKYIPEIYKNGSIKQREELIAGLVDSDGYVSGNGTLSITTSSQRMAKDIQEIIWSLGGIAKISEGQPYYTYKGVKKKGKVAYTIGIRYSEPRNLSKLSRKRNLLPENYQYSDSSKNRELKLKIKDIEYSRTTDAQCIMIDHPDHLYITDNYVVTHNTDLVRRLVKKLEFNNKFIEIQLDSVNNSFGYNSIHSIIRNSTIQEEQPGILLLDEMQRFRTVDAAGGDIKPDKYQDIWMLLSDGKFALDSTLFEEIEMMILNRDFNDDQGEEDDDDDLIEPAKKKKTNTKFKIWPYEAKDLKRILKRSESIAEIMTWDPNTIRQAIIEFKAQYQNVENDYSKLLIFISGNLDELFTESTHVFDSDVDADFFHENTKKLTPADVKKALLRRFRPEQISRFGSNNIIYPSLSKNTYKRIIANTCQKYSKRIENLSGINFTITDHLYQEIYDNAVYPAQGTRPVFSAIHQILGAGLSDFAMWALENSISNVQIDIDAKNQKLIGISSIGKKYIDTLLELRSVKSKITPDFKTLLAVHEIGHSIVYASLFKIAPKEIRINLASRNGAYMQGFDDASILSKKGLLDNICVSLSGVAAEVIVFGDENQSCGHTADLAHATLTAANYVRNLGFHHHVNSYIQEPIGGEDTNYNSDLARTNTMIEKIITDEQSRAYSILQSNIKLMKVLVNELLEKSIITSNRFKELTPELELSDKTDLLTNYAERWEKYKRAN